MVSLLKLKVTVFLQSVEGNSFLVNGLRLCAEKQLQILGDDLTFGSGICLAFDDLRIFFLLLGLGLTFSDVFD